MKKISTILMLLTLFYSSLPAQTQTTEVLSAAGATSTTKTMQLDWTLGESCIQTSTSQDIMITEGFHQPAIRVELIPHIEKDKLIAGVYPNPTSDVIQVVLSENKQVSGLLLQDDQGKTIATYHVQEKSIKNEIRLDHLTSGVYYLSPVNTDGITGQSYRLIKI